MENKRRGPGRPRVEEKKRKVAHSISFDPDVLKWVNAENPYDRSKAVDALIRKAKRLEGLVPPLPTEI